LVVGIAPPFTKCGEAASLAEAALLPVVEPELEDFVGGAASSKLESSSLIVFVAGALAVAAGCSEGCELAEDTGVEGAEDAGWALLGFGAGVVETGAAAAGAGVVTALAAGCAERP
jgi:hypothetical protein